MRGLVPNAWCTTIAQFSVHRMPLHLCSQKPSSGFDCFGKSYAMRMVVYSAAKGNILSEGVIWLSEQIQFANHIDPPRVDYLSCRPVWNIQAYYPERHSHMHLILLRTYNLDWARFIYGDEYRAFYTWKGNMFTPFLSMVYGIPARLFGTYHHLALLSSAVIGAAGILVTYLIGRDGFNRRSGLYSALVLAVLVLHIKYSRTVFPCVLQSLLILLAFRWLQAFFSNHRTNRANVFRTGTCLGLAFLTYIPSYASIGAFFILILIQSIGFTARERLRVFAVFTVSVVVPPLLYAVYFSLRPGPNYMAFFLSGRDYTSTFIKPKMAVAPIRFLENFFHFGGVLQLCLVLFGAAYCLFAWFRTRNRFLLGILVFALASHFIFSLAGLLKVHTMYPRHYIYLTPFFCLCAGHLLEKITERFGKKIAGIFLVIFTAISIGESMELAQATFKIEPIERWLYENRINKAAVLTRLDLTHEWHYGASHGTLLPGELEDERFVIDWKGVEQRYAAGYRYLLTSGIGPYCTVGLNNPRLAASRPLKKWVHPFRKMKNDYAALRGF